MQVSEVLSTENVHELIEALWLRMRYCDEGIDACSRRRDEEGITQWQRKRKMAEDLRLTLQRIADER